MMSEDTSSATSLPASEDGRLPLNGQDGAAPSGTGSCPCQPLSSAGQRKGPCRRTPPLARFSTPYRRVRPWGRFWESRLRQRMAGNGSPLYDLTWSNWDMPAGPQIYRQRASARRTSGNDSTGWQSPTAADGKSRMYQYDNHDKTKPRLTNEGQMAGWPTPDKAEGGQSAWNSERKGNSYYYPSGRKTQVGLGVCGETGGVADSERLRTQEQYRPGNVWNAKFVADGATQQRQRLWT